MWLQPYSWQTAAEVNKSASGHLQQIWPSRQPEKCCNVVMLVCKSRVGTFMSHTVQAAMLRHILKTEKVCFLYCNIDMSVRASLNDHSCELTVSCTLATSSRRSVVCCQTKLAQTSTCLAVKRTSLVCQNRMLYRKLLRTVHT